MYKILRSGLKLRKRSSRDCGPVHESLMPASVRLVRLFFIYFVCLWLRWREHCKVNKVTDCCFSVIVSLWRRVELKSTSCDCIEWQLQMSSRCHCGRDANRSVFRWLLLLSTGDLWRKAVGTVARLDIRWQWLVSSLWITGTSAAAAAAAAVC